MNERRISNNTALNILDNCKTCNTLHAQTLSVHQMFRLFCLLFLVAYCNTSTAQSAKIDSLRRLLLFEKEDSNSVSILWKLAEQYQFFKPDTTVQLAQKALLLARHINYTEGESRSLAVMATGQYLLGNYTAALNNYMQKLQIEEKRNSSRNYASALNNIGLMYILLSEYPNALDYLRRADSTVQVAGDVVKKELGNKVLVNLGETFFRMKKMDSANVYFSAALETGITNQDVFYQGTALLGLGNVYASLGKDSIALHNYRQALIFLNDGSNNDMLCETAIGLANVFEKMNLHDSAKHYAKLSFETGKRDGFQSRELDAAGFLSSFYKRNRKYDSAFAYMELAITLKDSLKGQAKTRETMIISTNEQLRQAEMAEQKRIEAATRVQQLQILAICLFIPMFFLVTLVLSRIRIHRNVVRFMGVVSLLLFFEFLILLLHPFIGNLMHHNKVLELLALVVIGAGLVPLHHRLEKFILTKLIQSRSLKDTSLALTATEEIVSNEIDVTNDLLIDNEEISPSEMAKVEKISASAADATEAEMK